MPDTENIGRATYGIIDKTLDHYKLQLLALDNVHALGAGEKYVDGKPTGKLCIRVSVKRKTKVKHKDSVPKRLKAISSSNKKLRFFIETDVIEIRENFEAFGISGNDKF